MAASNAAVDLTNIGAVKDWLGIDETNSDADDAIQDVITGFSQYVLTATGIASFSQATHAQETRDGNGNSVMYVRTRPIINVNSVTVSGVAVPAAGAWPSFGWYVSDDKKYIVIREGFDPRSFSYGPNYRVGVRPLKGFIVGLGNIALDYYGGYAQVPFDLELKVRQACAINYKRKQNLDLASKSIASGGTTGTTRFRDWKVPPEVEEVIEYYRRLAVV